MNTKLIPIPDYLLLVDTKAIIPKGVYHYDVQSKKVFRSTEYTEENRKIYTDAYLILAHLPLNQAPVLEGVPLLPPLPPTPPKRDVLQEAKDFTLSHYKNLEKSNPKGGYLPNETLFSVIEGAVETGFKFAKYELPKQEEDDSALQKRADEFGEYWAGNNGSYDDLDDEDQAEELEEEKDKYSFGFYYGYKAAAQEKKWSDADMRKMYDLSCGKIGLDLSNDQTENNNRFNTFLQSLSPAPFPADFIPDYQDGHYHIINNTLQGTYL